MQGIRWQALLHGRLDTGVARDEDVIADRQYRVQEPKFTEALPQLTDLLPRVRPRVSGMREQTSGVRLDDFQVEAPQREGICKCRGGLRGTDLWLKLHRAAPISCCRRIRVKQPGCSCCPVPRRGDGRSSSWLYVDLLIQAHSVATQETIGL